MSSHNFLMVADSEHNADMLYAIGIFVPDPLVFLQSAGLRMIVVNDMEIDRARKMVRNCRVLPQSLYLRKLAQQGRKRKGLVDIVSCLLREHQLKKVRVPESFPHGLAESLRRSKVKVKVHDGPPFPERTVKSAMEVRKISASLTMAEVGLAEAVQVLKRSKIGRRGRLLYHDVPLTSEKIRAVIDVAVIQAGGSANHTIVAQGRQACDPHETGHGPLIAHEPIIIDVFPRSQKTGYYGDITRTVVKGRASDAVRALYSTVLHAQKTAFQLLRPNTPTAKIHNAVNDLFVRAGYKTRRNDGHLEGFFHSTGHGVGLEIHEAPRISQLSKETFQVGNVVALEPGLYYPNIGAVRLEDVALVTTDKARNLTKFEKVLEV
jgi:Xaa-Pro aminopeptidase